MTIKQILSRFNEPMIKWYFILLNGHPFWDPRSGILGGIIFGTVITFVFFI